MKQDQGSPSSAQLDGLRGLALVLLVVCQATVGFDPARDTSAVLARLSWPGERAFGVLFVVLGYWLMRREPRWAGRPFQNIAQLAWYSLPLYYIALLGTLLLVKLVPALSVPAGSIWDASDPAFSSGGLLSHGLLVHNWFPRWMLRINPTLWVVAAGFQGCVLFVTVLAPLWRWRGVLPVLGCASLALAVEHRAWFVLLIALGAWACAERERRLPFGRIGLALGLLCLAVACVSPRSELLSELVAGVTTAALLIWLEQRGQSLRVFAPLGRASYACLLTFLPILALCHVRFGSALPGIPIALAAGVGFHFAIERRFRGTLRPLMRYVRPLGLGLGGVLALLLVAAAVEFALERRDLHAVEQHASYLTLGEQRIRYRLHEGDPELPAIVFLSAMGPLEEFDAISSKLDPRVPFLAYDRCNMGWSAADNTGCTPEQAAQELTRVLDALRLRRVFLIGYSVSAMQVRAFVHDQGERVAGAIFIDPRSPEAVTASASELNWAGRHAVDVWLAGKLLRSLFGYQRLYAASTQPVVELAQVSAKHAWAALRAFRAFEGSQASDFDRAAFSSIPAALISVSDPGERFGRLMLDAQHAAIERAAEQQVLLIHDVPHWELLNDARSTRRIAEFIQSFCHSWG